MAELANVNADRAKTHAQARDFMESANKMRKTLGEADASFDAMLQAQALSKGFNILKFDKEKGFFSDVIIEEKAEPAPVVVKKVEPTPAPKNDGPWAKEKLNQPYKQTSPPSKPQQQAKPAPKLAPIESVERIEDFEAHGNCRHWMLGGCKLGNSCKFAHDEWAKNYFQLPCTYWANGHCAHGNSCGYSHAGPKGKRTPTRQCKHFARGHCNLGNDCNFGHW